MKSISCVITLRFSFTPGIDINSSEVGIIPTSLVHLCVCVCVCVGSLPIQKVNSIKVSFFFVFVINKISNCRKFDGSPIQYSIAVIIYLCVMQPQTFWHFYSILRNVEMKSIL